MATRMFGRQVYRRTSDSLYVVPLAWRINNGDEYFVRALDVGEMVLTNGFGPYVACKRVPVVTDI